MRYPIETPRLRLEPFQASDTDALYRMESDAQVKQFAGGVLTRAQTEKLLKRFIESTRESGFGAIAIKLQGTNEIVGLCGLYLTSEGEGAEEAELFYGLARHAWGQGYATEACQALTTAAIQQTWLKKIVASVDPQNSRSIRVLERIGMRFSHVEKTSDPDGIEHVFSLHAGESGAKVDSPPVWA